MTRGRGRARRLGARARALATLVALGSVGVVLAACSLLTGLDADYMLKGSVLGDEDGVPEAGKPDSPGDAMADGSTTDGPTTDGGDAGRFCQEVDPGPVPADFFCADFEDGDIDIDAGLATGWTGVKNNVVSGTGTMKLLAGAGVNQSRGLDVESAAAGARTQRVYKAFVKPPAKEADQYLAYELDFEFRVVASDIPYDALGLLVFANQVPAREHGIAGYGPLSPHLLSRQAPKAVSTTTVPNNPAAWHHARVRLSHTDAGAPFDRSIQIAGNEVDDVPTGHRMDAGAPTEFWMGIFNANDPGTAHVQFDNVVIRRR